MTHEAQQSINQIINPNSNYISKKILIDSDTKSSCELHMLLKIIIIVNTDLKHFKSVDCVITRVQHNIENLLEIVISEDILYKILKSKGQICNLKILKEEMQKPDTIYDNFNTLLQSKVSPFLKNCFVKALFRYYPDDCMNSSWDNITQISKNHINLLFDILYNKDLYKGTKFYCLLSIISLLRKQKKKDLIIFFIKKLSDNDNLNDIFMPSQGTEFSVYTESRSTHKDILKENYNFWALIPSYLILDILFFKEEDLLKRLCNILVPNTENLNLLKTIKTKCCHQSVIYNALDLAYTPTLLRFKTTPAFIYIPITNDTLLINEDDTIAVQTQQTQKTQQAINKGDNYTTIIQYKFTKAKETVISNRLIMYKYDYYTHKYKILPSNCIKIELIYLFKVIELMDLFEKIDLFPFLKKLTINIGVYMPNMPNILENLNIEINDAYHKQEESLIILLKEEEIEVRKNYIKSTEKCKKTKSKLCKKTKSKLCKTRIYATFPKEFFSENESKVKEKSESTGVKELGSPPASGETKQKNITLPELKIQNWTIEYFDNYSLIQIIQHNKDSVFIENCKQFYIKINKQYINKIIQLYNLKVTKNHNFDYLITLIQEKLLSKKISLKIEGIFCEFFDLLILHIKNLIYLYNNKYNTIIRRSKTIFNYEDNLFITNNLQDITLKQNELANICQQIQSIIPIIKYMIHNCIHNEVDYFITCFVTQKKSFKQLSIDLFNTNIILKEWLQNKKERIQKHKKRGMKITKKALNTDDLKQLRLIEFNSINTIFTCIQSINQSTEFINKEWID